MIYVDTSVVLAHLLGEERVPPTSLWAETLVTCRLTHYETWVRIHARKLTRSHGDAARAVLARFGVVELHPHAMQRALEPFPVAVRTLDALHLAAIEYLRAQRQAIELATYDTRLADAARRLGITLAFPPDA